ncbi:MAG: hypothetical protein R3E89_10920 [Thiolinea sp.]
MRKLTGILTAVLMLLGLIVALLPADYMVEAGLDFNDKLMHASAFWLCLAAGHGQYPGFLALGRYRYCSVMAH